MDLRVYVDGIARIICDLTPNTTVHDIIIALAQYKGKAGRYSLIERAPSGAQRTLSPSELTNELIHHPDWSYILRQNSNHSSTAQKRSKSLDERKISQPIVETVTSSLSSSSTTSAQFQPVHNNHTNGFATLSSSSSSSTKSSLKNKHLHVQQIFPSINTNNNNNNNHLQDEFFLEQKRSSRTPIQIIEQDFGTLDNHRRPRPKSALPLLNNDHSAFHLVHNQNHQYTVLLKLLKSQEIQVEQQQKELDEKQQEIEFREKTLHHHDLENEIHFLTMHDRRLSSDCQMYSEDYLTNELENEFDYKKKLNINHEHFQQRLNRCSTTLEQKQQLQNQIQLNIEQLQHEIEQTKTTVINEKQDINQYQHELDCANVSLNQQEDLVRKLTERNEDFECNLQQRRQQITDLENELIKLDQILMQNLSYPNYNFQSNSSIPQHYNSLPSTNSFFSASTGTSTDGLVPGRLQFVNSTLWKLCPSGIWV